MNHIISLTYKPLFAQHNPFVHIGWLINYSTDIARNKKGHLFSYHWFGHLFVISLYDTLLPCIHVYLNQTVLAVFTDASVFGDTNLELPSFLSDHSIVEIHMDVDLITLSALKYEYELEVSIELPLHARYPVSNFGNVEHFFEAFVYISLELLENPCAYVVCFHAFSQWFSQPVRYQR